MHLIAEKDGNLYSYTENIWTGKKELTLNGVALEKRNREVFAVNRDGAEELITVKGNFLMGVTLVEGDGKNIVLVQNKWYEWVLIVLPLLGIGVGLFGGAIGSVLSVLFCLLCAGINATILRSNVKFGLKIAGCIFMALVMNLAWFLIYAAIAGGLFEFFSGKLSMMKKRVLLGREPVILCKLWILCKNRRQSLKST